MIHPRLTESFDDLPAGPDRARLAGAVDRPSIQRPVGDVVVWRPVRPDQAALGRGLDHDLVGAWFAGHGRFRHEVELDL